MSELMDKAVSALAERFSNAEENLDAKVKFEIDDVGTVMVDATQTPATVAPGDGDADVTVSAPVEVFEQLMTREVDPTAAYMSGQLRIDGDMSLAMKLAQVLA